MAGTNTTRISLYKPNPADDINVETDLNDNLDLIDLNMNFRICTSGTRPSSPYAGQAIYETDTGAAYVRNNSSTWVQFMLNSTGSILLNNTTDLSLSSTGHAFQVGASSGANLGMDNNEIMARNNGSAATLGLNLDGGNITLGSSASTVTIAGTLVVEGQGFSEYIYRTTTLTRNNTSTLANDTVLTTTLAASSVYLIEFNLNFAALNAAKIKSDWTVPSGATGLRSVVGPGSTSNQASADNISGRYGVHNFSTATTYGTRDSEVNMFNVLETGIVTTTSSGTLALRWSQNTANGSDAILGAGSLMRITKLS